jgi:N-acetylglucosaminyl-diphospho-decaprenol L-rhamnosyltransferase
MAALLTATTPQFAQCYQERIHPPYILLLNPDTIVRPGALQALVDFMDKHPDVGIAGSRLEDPGWHTTASQHFASIPSISELEQGLRLGILSKLLNNWQVAPPVSQETCQTDWVAGASMIVRREVFEAVGLIDEAYFMYYEEMDFCLQAQRAGFSCWYVPQSRVIHLVGQSSGVTDSKRPPKRLPQYWFDSRQRYFLKNYGWLYTAIADASSGLQVLPFGGYVESFKVSQILDPPQFLT